MGCQQKEGIDYTDTYASVMPTRTFARSYNFSIRMPRTIWIIGMCLLHSSMLL
jgi:hypothetical protein